MDKYGARVKAIREVLGLNQKQLATALGISPPAVSVIEGDVKGLSMAVFERLVVDLGANPYFILLGTKPILLFEGSKLVSQIGAFVVRRVGDENNTSEVRQGNTFDNLKALDQRMKDVFGSNDDLLYQRLNAPLGGIWNDPAQKKREKEEGITLEHLKLEVKKITESLKKAGLFSESPDEKSEQE